MPTATHSRSRRVDRRTRAARGDQRDGRTALLEAALEVFAERGYRDATVDEIAERAGYSKGAIYFHFSAKEDLFFALLEERIDAPLYVGLELLATGPPEQDMSVEASRQFTQMLREQREILLLDQEFCSLALRDERLRRRYIERERRRRSAMADALRARLDHLGAPPAGNPDRMAGSILALIGGLYQQKLIDPGGLPDESLGEMLALSFAGHVARASAQA
jgi:AcrR family transcriptional regulator